MSEPGALVERLSLIVGGENARVADPVDSLLKSVRLDISAARSESEGTISETIFNVPDSFSVEAYSDTLGSSAGVSSDQAWVLFFL